MRVDRRSSRTFFYSTAEVSRPARPCYHSDMSSGTQGGVPQPAALPESPAEECRIKVPLPNLVSNRVGSYTASHGHIWLFVRVPGKDSLLRKAVKSNHLKGHRDANAAVVALAAHVFPKQKPVKFVNWLQTEYPPDWSPPDLMEAHGAPNNSDVLRRAPPIAPAGTFITPPELTRCRMLSPTLEVTTSSRC